MKDGQTKCPQEALDAIHGTSSNKGANYMASLKSWWRVYTARKKDNPDEEYLANSLHHYDPEHLPHSPAATPPASPLAPTQQQR